MQLYQCIAMKKNAKTIDYQKPEYRVKQQPVTLFFYKMKPFYYNPARHQTPGIELTFLWELCKN